MERSITKLLTIYANNIWEVFSKKLTEKYGDIPELKIKLQIEIMKQQFNWTDISSNPYKYAHSINVEKLEQCIKLANQHYYNSESVMEDNVYDILVECLKERKHNSKILDEIGASIVGKFKVTLPTFMPSMNKIKADTGEVKKWCIKYPGSYTVSDKLDGMSMLIHNDEGNIRAYTRGDGKVGQDISWIVNYIKIGNTHNGDMVRGECVVSKTNWGIIKAKYPKYSNARNFVSGYTGSKTVDPKLMKYIDFVAYEYITEIPKRYSNQFQCLSEMGFDVVFWESREKVDNSSLSNLLENRREASTYEVDGIIIASDDKGYTRMDDKYPKYAKAFKMVLDDQTAEVSVLGITWNPSMHGVLKPIVNISPVVLDGAKIRNVTGNNAKNIVNNAIGGVIGPGAIVKLTRSGGVIPKILKIVKPYGGESSNVLPMQTEFGKYSWNSTNVDIVLKRPELNKTVVLKRIEHFFGTLSVPYFKTGIIKKVFDVGYNTIPKILNMTVENLLTIDGIKEKIANKIFNAIQKGYNSATLTLLMSGSHVFGSGFGKRVIKPILSKFPNILDIDLNNSSQRDKLFNGITGLKGYQSTTAQKFIIGLPKFINFHENLPAQNKVQSNTQEIKIIGDKFNNQIYSYTGFRPDEKLKKYIISNGGKLESSVKSNVTHLLVKKKSSKKTKKILDAEAKGIQIIYLVDF